MAWLLSLSAASKHSLAAKKPHGGAHDGGDDASGGQGRREPETRPHRSYYIPPGLAPSEEPAGARQPDSGAVRYVDGWVWDATKVRPTVWKARQTEDIESTVRYSIAASTGSIRICQGLQQLSHRHIVHFQRPRVYNEDHPFGSTHRMPHWIYQKHLRR